MKKMTRLLALLVALLMCMLPALAETAAEAGSPEDVMATLNDSVVTRAEYEECLTQLQDLYASYGYDVTDATIAAVLQEIALDTALEYEMLALLIEQNGLQLTAEESADASQEAREDFYAQIDEIVDQYGMYGMADVSTEAGRAAVMVEVLSQLETMGVTEASYIEDALVFAGYDKAYDWLVREVVVSDDEVRARYDSLVEADRVAYANDVEAYEGMLQNNQMALMYGMTEYYVDLYYVPEGYRIVTHILLEADDTALANYTAVNANEESTPEQIAEAEQAVLASVQDRVDEINARLAAGESFNDLIPEYTMDPGMSDAASIAEGYEVHPESTRWVTPFRDAAFTVENVGDVTAPVITDYGVHILCYSAEAVCGPMPYTDDVRALLHEELLTAAQSNQYAESMAALLEAAEIVYSEEAQAFMTND